MVIGNKRLIKNYSGILSDETIKKYKIRELKQRQDWDLIFEEDEQIKKICLEIQKEFLKLGFKIKPSSKGKSLWELNT